MSAYCTGAPCCSVCPCERNHGVSFSSLQDPACQSQSLRGPICGRSGACGEIPAVLVEDREVGTECLRKTAHRRRHCFEAEQAQHGRPVLAPAQAPSAPLIGTQKQPLTASELYALQPDLAHPEALKNVAYSKNLLCLLRAKAAHHERSLPHLLESCPSGHEGVGPVQLGQASSARAPLHMHTQPSSV